MGRCAVRNRSIKVLSNAFEELQKFLLLKQRERGGHIRQVCQGLINNVKLLELLYKSKWNKTVWDK